MIQLLMELSISDAFKLPSQSHKIHIQLVGHNSINNITLVSWFLISILNKISLEMTYN